MGDRGSAAGVDLSYQGNNGGSGRASKQVREMEKKRWEEREKVPDYETENPFGECGRRKLVYRSRRSR